MTGEWRTLHDQELNDLYASPGATRVFKPRMRRAGHEARKGAVYIGYWWGHLREGGHLEDIDRRRRKDKIKMIPEVKWWGIDWIEVA